MPHKVRVTQKLYVKCYICSSSTLFPSPSLNPQRQKERTTASISKVSRPGQENTTLHTKNHRLLSPNLTLVTDVDGRISLKPTGRARSKQ